eukprot:TRINITY_DN225_c0_g1_i1.p4 TRINITY_DN225_c0_g1~~TRINITY_DN225_c0_g1_i1.p4  ORF type:complete len:104 (-),score=32.48 TRINITY_DN225_c0_g1_i1:1919-2197(-)
MNSKEKMNNAAEKIDRFKSQLKSQSKCDDTPRGRDKDMVSKGVWESDCKSFKEKECDDQEVKESPPPQKNDEKYRRKSEQSKPKYQGCPNKP